MLMTRPTGKEALTTFEPILRKLKNKKDVVIDFDDVIETIEILKEVRSVKYTNLLFNHSLC
ncbi:MAG: hypothetical protein BWY34_00420 [Parcubacteria group bacterium ADurb.Bin247]|nr:MAG: hypothetical protein BWY34_00420 [Parcubacteria group bacterium ADurb.Bin247]